MPETLTAPPAAAAIAPRHTPSWSDTEWIAPAWSVNEPSGSKRRSPRRDARRSAIVEAAYILQAVRR